MSILGPEVGWTDLLDYEITEKLKREQAAKVARTTKGSHPLRPSSAGYCGRRLAYDLMEYRGHAFYAKPLLEPHVYRLFELGHAIEWQALKTFSLIPGVTQKYKQQILTFFPLERAIEGQPEEIVEGSTDFVLWSEKFKGIGDVKSKKDKFSSAFKTGWDEELEKIGMMETVAPLSATAFWVEDLDAFIEELGDDFLIDNLYQLNLYANSDFIKARGIDHAFLYRYCKNDSRHMEIRFKPSASAYEEVRNKFNAVTKAVDLKQPDEVKKDFVLGSIRCAFCPYQNACWGEDVNASKEFYSTLPRKKWPTDSARLEEGEVIEKLFEEYESLQVSTKKLERTEKEIIKLLDASDTPKVKLSNGHVYEVKKLKSPRPHFELRRSKL